MKKAMLAAVTLVVTALVAVGTAFAGHFKCYETTKTPAKSGKTVFIKPYHAEVALLMSGVNHEADWDRKQYIEDALDKINGRCP